MATAITTIETISQEADGVEYVKGDVRNGETEGGSSYYMDSRVDYCGRAYTHVITGSKNNRSQYLARNISAKDVLDMIGYYEEHGYQHISASPEGF